MPCRVVLPTSSMSRVRTHFCTLVARWYGGVCCPVKYGMNGTMPATEQQGRVVVEQRGAGHDGVAAVLEVVQEAAADLGGLHGWSSSGRFGVGSADALRAARDPVSARVVDLAGRVVEQVGDAAPVEVPRHGGAQPVLALGRGLPHRVGELAAGRRPGSTGPRRGSRRCPAGVYCCATCAGLAHDQHADGRAERDPEHPADHALLRRPRVGPDLAAAHRLAHAVGERRDLDHRRAERGGEQRRSARRRSSPPARRCR